MGKYNALEYLVVPGYYMANCIDRVIISPSLAYSLYKSTGKYEITAYTILSIEFWTSTTSMIYLIFYLRNQSLSILDWQLFSAILKEHHEYHQKSLCVSLVGVYMKRQE